jgi:hypothetical protein
MKNCCSNKRNEWKATQVTQQNVSGPPAREMRNYNAGIAPSVRLKYIGDSYLILKGSIKRKVYHFHAPQTILEVDGADASSMIAHPLITTA